MPANPQVEAYIRQAAISRGIDPEYAVRVSRAEALNVFDPNAGRDGGGDGGSSFGPFQLHYGGVNKAMPNGGLGDEFTKATGLDARNPSTWQQQVDFSLNTAKRDGWRQWMGAANTGIPRWAGIGKGVPTQAAQPPVMDGPRGDEQTQPAGYSTRPQGPVEAAGGGRGSDPRNILASLFSNHPAGPVEAAGGGAGSEAGAGADPAAAKPTFLQSLTKNIGKLGAGSIAAMTSGQPGRSGGMPQPQAARTEQADAPPIDPQANEQQRQMLALAMQRLNSGRLF